MYDLIYDQIDGIFFENDIDVVVFEEIEFDGLDLIVIGFDLLQDMADIRGMGRITLRDQPLPGGSHVHFMFVDNVVLVGVDIRHNGFLLLFLESGEGFVLI